MQRSDNVERNKRNCHCNRDILMLPLLIFNVLCHRKVNDTSHNRPCYNMHVKLTRWRNIIVSTHFNLATI